MTNNFTDKKVGEKRKVISKFIKDTNIDLKDQLQRNNIHLTNKIDRVNTEEMNTIYNFVKDNLGIDLNNNYNGTPELRRLMSLLKEGDNTPIDIRLNKREREVTPFATPERPAIEEEVEPSQAVTATPLQHEMTVSVTPAKPKQGRTSKKSTVLPLPEPSQSQELPEPSQSSAQAMQEMQSVLDFYHNVGADQAREIKELKEQLESTMNENEKLSRIVATEANQNDAYENQLATLRNTVQQLNQRATSIGQELHKSQSDNNVNQQKMIEDNQRLTNEVQRLTALGNKLEGDATHEVQRLRNENQRLLLLGEKLENEIKTERESIALEARHAIDTVSHNAFMEGYRDAVSSREKPIVSVLTKEDKRKAKREVKIGKKTAIEIAKMIANLSLKERIEILNILDPKKRNEVIVILPNEVKQEAIQEFANANNKLKEIIKNETPDRIKPVHIATEEEEQDDGSHTAVRLFPSTDLQSARSVSNYQEEDVETARSVSNELQSARSESGVRLEDQQEIMRMALLQARQAVRDDMRAQMTAEMNTVIRQRTEIMDAKVKQIVTEKDAQIQELNERYNKAYSALEKDVKKLQSEKMKQEVEKIEAEKIEKTRGRRPKGHVKPEIKNQEEDVKEVKEVKEEIKQQPVGHIVESHNQSEVDEEEHVQVENEIEHENDEISDNENEDENKKIPKPYSRKSKLPIRLNEINSVRIQSGLERNKLPYKLPSNIEIYKNFKKKISL